MYRVRFHGRGGQGIKTASRILGTALFHEGFEVQDAPRYGAERRGAPIFAYVRAAREPIRERGVIAAPDLVVVADETLVGQSAAAVLQGVEQRTVLLINSREPAALWRQRLNLELAPITLELAPAGEQAVGPGCAGAAARLLGVVSESALHQAVDEELLELDPAARANGRRLAMQAFSRAADWSGRVRPGSTPTPAEAGVPDWVDLAAEPAPTSAPAIRATATSVQVETGLWRTHRPVIDRERCRHCWWVCGSACPDGAINLDAKGDPQIDYTHCKGCLVCVAQCPPQAIEVVDERSAAETSTEAAGP